MPQGRVAMLDRTGPVYRWLVTLAALLAFFTMVFSSTMMNVAIPHVMGAYGVGQDKAQFLSTAFLATTTTSLLLNSWFIARIGQRSAFTLSLVLYCLASALCGFSPNLDMIILGRVIQGFAAGIIQPMVMVVLFQIFPTEKRGLAMALFSMGVVFALGLGPALGGVAIDLLNWRYIFAVPIPTAVLALVLGLLFLPERPQTRSAGPFDFLGYSLMCTAVFCLMTGIGNGQRLGWDSDDILMLFAFSLAATVGLILSQRRARANLLDLSLFANLRFVNVISISFMFGAGSFATVYMFPVFGQIVQGYSATTAGSLLLPGSIVAACILPLTGRLVDRFPPQSTIMVGLIIFFVSVVFMADADVDTLFWHMAFYLFMSRVGVALVSPSVNNAALRALEPAQLNQGAGVVGLFLMLGGSCGINSLVVVLERRIQFHGQAFVATQTSANPATSEMLGAVRRLLQEEGFPPPINEPFALKYLGDVVYAQANTLGFQDGFFAVAAMTLFALIPALLLIRRQGGPDVRRPTRQPR